MRRYPKNRNFLLLFLVLTFALSGCLNSISDNKNSTDLHWIEDKSNEMTFEDVNEKDVLTQWNLAESKQPNFSYTDSAYWFNLSFENTKSEPASMLLELAFPLHDSVDVYLLQGEELVSTYNTGDQSSFSQRPLDHRNFLFPQMVEPKEALRAVVRVKSTDAMYVPLKVWDSNEFFTKDEHEVLFVGVAFGFLLIMLIYNLFLYVLTKNISYFYYVCYAASIIYLQLSQKGIGYQYLWSESPFFNQISTSLSTYVAVLTGVTFIWKFLDLEKKSRLKVSLFLSLFFGYH